MKKLFTLLIFNTFICQSQVGYYDGYYIDNNNQKFNIKIKDYTFDEEVKYLFYKEEGTENELSIPIENIQSFVFKKNRDFVIFREVVFNDYFEVDENNVQTKKVILNLISNGKNTSFYHRLINQKDEFFFTDLTKQAFILNEKNFKEVIKKAFYFETDEIFENIEFNKNKLVLLFNKINLMEEIIIKEIEEKNLNITTLEEIPIYPGCEQLATKETKMQCFNKKFLNHFSNNFNMPEIVKNQPNEVNIRVFASFVIDKDGYIKLTDVRAPFPEIEIELRKVFEKFPKITPGKKDGNPVSVRYTMPINLKTETPVNTDYYKRNNRYDPNRLHPYSTKN